MPIDGNRISSTFTFQHKYQYFTANISIQYVQNAGVVQVSYKIEQTRSAIWQRANIINVSSGNFVPTIEKTWTLTYAIDTQLSPERWIQWARPIVRNNITQDTREAWNNNQIDQRDGETEEDYRQRAHNLTAWTNAHRFSAPSSLIERVSQEFTQVANVWLQAQSCPDGWNNCSSLHFLRTDHVLVANDRYIPSSEVRSLYITEDDGQERTILYWVADPMLTPRIGAFVEQAQARRFFGYSECHACEDIRPLDTGVTTNGLFFCRNCQGNLAICEQCNQRYPEDSLEIVETFDDEEGEYYDIPMCRRCASRHQRGTQNLSLMNYSYKPEPNFHGDGPMFMGMEIEVARRHTTTTQRVNRWIRNLPSDLFYVKSDSSVSAGMEVVTHPFTYKWAENNFPYNLFEELIQIDGIIPDHQSAGTHIHVNKSAFDRGHLWKYILFFLENQQFFGQLGGRGHTHRYGSFQDVGSIRENLMAVVKAKGDANLLNFATGRGAININPENTIEMRFMAGDASPEGIRKNQQLVQAAFDFTKMVKSSDALKGALGDPGYFLGYLEDTNYEDLRAFVSKIFPMPKKLERSY